MSDEIVPSNPNANLPDHARRMQDLLGGVANIANSIQDAGGVASGLDFIGVNGDGKWSFGQQRTEVETGSFWAIDIRTLQHGYIAWPPAGQKDRKPLGERMVPANSALPALSSLPDVGVPYQLQFGFEITCLSGEDVGQTMQYKNGSRGAKVMIQDLVNEVRKQARLDPEKLSPVVTLEIRDYFHPEWRKTIYEPVAKIHRWISYEEYDTAIETTVGTAAATEPDPEPEAPKPQPRVAGRGNGRPAPQPEPEVAAAPTPRRRTRVG